MIESRNPMKHLCRLANLCVTRRHATTAERSAFSSLKPNLPFRFHSLSPAVLPSEIRQRRRSNYGGERGEQKEETEGAKEKKIERKETVADEGCFVGRYR